MGDYEAYTVSKENVEDDRALLTSGVIGTGTAVEKQPILDRYTHEVNTVHIKSSTHRARIISPLPLRVAKTGRNHLNEEFTPLLPTGIGERF